MGVTPFAANTWPSMRDVPPGLGFGFGFGFGLVTMGSSLSFLHASNEKAAPISNSKKNKRDVICKGLLGLRHANVMRLLVAENNCELFILCSNKMLWFNRKILARRITFSFLNSIRRKTPPINTFFP